MKVALTRSAQASLREIAKFIQRDNPLRAKSFSLELRAKAIDIGNAPNLYPRYLARPDLDVRCRVVGSYLILYRVDPDRVVILEFRHGARDTSPLR